MNAHKYYNNLTGLSLTISEIAWIMIQVPHEDENNIDWERESLDEARAYFDDPYSQQKFARKIRLKILEELPKYRAQLKKRSAEKILDIG